MSQAKQYALIHQVVADLEKSVIGIVVNAMRQKDIHNIKNIAINMTILNHVAWEMQHVSGCHRTQTDLIMSLVYELV